MDHQSKNKEHKQLVAEMESGLKHVMLMAGTAQRLQGKVAIVTGAATCHTHSAQSSCVTFSIRRMITQWPSV